MSYYCFNRKEILQKAKERYSKENVAEYYLQNKEAIKKKVKGSKQKLEEYQRKRYQQLIQYKKGSITKKISFDFAQYKNQ